MSDAEYLEYLKGIASQIDESDLPQEYRPVALQLMAKPYFYAKTEGTEHEKDIPMSLASKIIEELKNKGGQ